MILNSKISLKKLNVMIVEKWWVNIRLILISRLNVRKDNPLVMIMANLNALLVDR